MGQVLHHRPRPTADCCPTGAPSWGRPGFAPSDPTRQLSPSPRVPFPFPFPFHAGDATRLVVSPEPTPTPACARQDAQSPWFSMMCSAPFNQPADVSGKSIGQLDTLQSDGVQIGGGERAEMVLAVGWPVFCCLCCRPGSVSQSVPVSSVHTAKECQGGDDNLGPRGGGVVGTWEADFV